MARVRDVKCVLWVGRHALLPAELAELRRLIGDDFVVERLLRVESVRHLEETATRLRMVYGCSIVIVSGTMPLTIYQRAAELAKTRRDIDVWYPVFETIIEYVDRATAERVCREHGFPERAAIQCYGDGSCKCGVFKGFKRLKEVKLVLEEIGT